MINPLADLRVTTLTRLLIAASCAVTSGAALAAPASAETICRFQRGVTTCVTETSTPPITHIFTGDAASDDDSVAWRFCEREVPTGSTVFGYTSFNSRFDVHTETTTTTEHRGATSRGPVISEASVVQDVITFVDTMEGTGGCFFYLPSGEEERWSFQIVASDVGD